MAATELAIAALAGRNCRNCNHGGAGFNCLLKQKVKTITTFNEKGEREVYTLPMLEPFPKEMICDSWEKEKSLFELLEIAQKHTSQ